MLLEGCDYWKIMEPYFLENIFVFLIVREKGQDKFNDLFDFFFLINQNEKLYSNFLQELSMW